MGRRESGRGGGGQKRRRAQGNGKFLKRDLFYFEVCLCVPWKLEELDPHEAGITSDCLQKEQYILLTTEPSLQPPRVRFGSTSKASVFEGLGISNGRASGDFFFP